VAQKQTAASKKRNREALRLLGFDTRRLTAAEIAEGGELVRKVTACGCGANSRRPKAIADWRVWAEQRSNIRGRPLIEDGPYADASVASARQKCVELRMSRTKPAVPRQSLFDPKTGAFAVNIRDTGGDDSELRESLKEFGWVKEFPALVDENGVVLVGHRRMKIAEEENIEPAIKNLNLGKGNAADAKRLKLAIVSNIGSKPMTPEDRKRIAEHLYGKREWTMARIAEALNVGLKTISRDLEGFVSATKPDRPKGGRPKGSRSKKKTPIQTPDLAPEPPQAPEPQHPPDEPSSPISPPVGQTDRAESERCESEPATTSADPPAKHFGRTGLAAYAPPVPVTLPPRVKVKRRLSGAASTSPQTAREQSSFSQAAAITMANGPTDEVKPEPIGETNSGPELPADTPAPAPVTEPVEPAPTPSAPATLDPALTAKLTGDEYLLVDALWTLHWLMSRGELTEKNLPAIIEAKPSFDHVDLLDLGKAIENLGHAWKSRERHKPAQENPAPPVNDPGPMPDFLRRTPAGTGVNAAKGSNGGLLEQPK
jgi:hypothetical protein